MRLLKVRFKQFRRFHDEQALDLNEDLVALVGPNEAGKSSILRAIEDLGNRNSPATVDVTRNAPGPAVVSGFYLLEESDRDAIRAIHGAAKVTHAWVSYRSDNTSTYWELIGYPKRDLAPRGNARDTLAALASDPALDEHYSNDANFPWNADLFVQAREIAASENETLDAQELDTLVAVAERLERLAYATDADDDGANVADEDARRVVRDQGAASLKKLVEFERTETPSRQIYSALLPRLPSVAVFRDQDRQLESSYTFDAVIADTPPALRNLAKIAELDFGAVQAARSATRTGVVERLFEGANARLKERYMDSWNQSNVYPRFGAPHEGILHVWIATEGESSYSDPSERSDGLRWFIALHAFLMALGDERPVLLVDEAETHLHYDAQADLIDALMRQKLTAKVIYSTHSVGCLPPDLGRGIRAVLPEKNAERSRIENSYWAIKIEGQEHVGYNPLLFAMGAQLLALTVPRFAVITEGSSDAVLLPTLLREASGEDSIGYRIVPGLADMEKERAGSIGSHAGTVVCLTDGDDAGRLKLRQIEKTGLDSKYLFNLGELLEGCTLEDLVAPAVFAHAVNLEIKTWGIEGLDVLEKDMPRTGRWNWLCGLATDVEGKPIAARLNKTRVAQRMVDQKREDGPGVDVPDLVDPSIRTGLSEMHNKITKALGV